MHRPEQAQLVRFLQNELDVICYLLRVLHSMSYYY